MKEYTGNVISATASSIYAAGYEAINCFNSDAGSIWSSAVGVTNPAIDFTLSQEISLKSLILRGRLDAPTEMITLADFYYWNGSSWIYIDTKRFYQNTNEQQVYLFGVTTENKNGQYVYYPNDFPKSSTFRIQIIGSPTRAFCLSTIKVFGK